MRHLLLILLIFGAGTAMAQKINISGFTVKREMPANVNDWKAGDVNAVAKSSNPQGGEKEARMVIQVKRGNSKVCGNDVLSASYENVTTKVISIRDVQAALGDCQLPPGQYSLCIQFFNIDKYDISGEQCREFTVAELVSREDPAVTTNQGNPSNPDNPSNPRTPATQVTPGTQAPKKYRRPDLIAPANDAKLKPEELKKPLTLRWTPVIPMPPNNDIAYTVVIFEVKGDQSDVQAMRSNPPIFEKEVRTTQAIWQVPAEYSSSKEPIRFVWNVKATNREGNPYGENGGMSETWAMGIATNKLKLCDQVKLLAVRIGDSSCFSISANISRDILEESGIAGLKLNGKNVKITSAYDSPEDWPITAAKKGKFIDEIAWPFIGKPEDYQQLNRQTLKLGTICLESTGTQFLVYEWVSKSGKVICKDSIKVVCGTKPNGEDSGVSEPSSGSESKNNFEIILQSPIGVSESEDSNPSFKWQIKEQRDDVFYQLLVYELKEGDNSAEVVQKRKPFYEAGTIRTVTHISTKEFNRKNAYAWQVVALDKQGDTLGSSGTAAFSFLPWNYFPWSFCFLWSATSTYNICQGTITNINVPQPIVTGTCQPGTMYYKIDGGAYIQVSTSTIPCPPLSLGQHTITFKLVCNCNNNTSYATAIINVFPNLQGASITGTNNGTLCYGQSAQLTVPGYTGNPAFLKWEYSDNNGSTWSSWCGGDCVGNNINTNPIMPASCSGISTLSVTRKYRVSYADPSIASSSLCNGIVNVNIDCETIAGTMTGPDQFCLAPGQSTVSATFTILNPKGTITWPPGGTGSATVHTYNLPVGTHTITATVQNGICGPKTVSKTVKVFAPVSCAAVTTKDTVCLNDDATVSVTYQNAGNNPSVQWQYLVDDNDINCSNNPASQWVNAGTGPSQNTNEIGNHGPYVPAPQNNITWRAIVTNNEYTGTDANCKSCTSCVRIIIRPKLCTPNIQLTAGTTPKCKGANVSLNAVLPAGCNSNSAYTYQWFLDGVAVTGESSSSTFTGIMPGNYQVQIKDQCDSALSKIFTVEDCIFNIAIKAPCCTKPNQPAVLSVTDLNGGGNLSTCGEPYTYEWRVSGNTTVIGTNSTINVTPNATTTYQVTVKDGRGCITTATVTILVCP